MVSGGVDSTVCAALLRKALNPDQVIAIHIDNGFMRKNESSLVEKSLQAVGLDLKSEYLYFIFWSQFLTLLSSLKQSSMLHYIFTMHPQLFHSQKRSLIKNTIQNHYVRLRCLKRKGKLLAMLSSD